MALGDVTIFDDGVFGFPGSKRHRVNNGGPADIKAGELVLKVLGTPYVTKWTAGSALKPVVNTDYIAGLAASTSDETLTAKGWVDVFPNLPGMTYLIAPATAATWDTQSEYDALVGDRVLLDCSSTDVQTILATDATVTKNQAGGWTGKLNGLIIEPLDVIKYPGKVRFSINQGLNYNGGM